MDFYESGFDALLIVCRVLIPECYPQVIPLSPLQLGVLWAEEQGRMSVTAAACECLGLLPTSLDTISSGDTLRFCLPCNLFCLSIWWMSCLPALPHTLENGGSRTLLNELQKEKQKAFVFSKQVFFVLMGVCNIVLTPCHVRLWIIKGEKLIWGERQGRSRVSWK